MVVEYIFNTSTGEAEEGRFLVYRVCSWAARSTQGNPILKHQKLKVKKSNNKVVRMVVARAWEKNAEGTGEWSRVSMLHTERFQRSPNNVNVPMSIKTLTNS